MPLLLLLTLILSLQLPPTPTPTPPEPEDVFTEHVTWEVVQGTPSLPLELMHQQRMLPVNIDNQQRVIALENGDEFPFPEDFLGINLTDYTLEGQTGLIALVAGEGRPSPWLFDATTGELTRYESPCEQAYAPGGSEDEFTVYLEYGNLLDGWVFARNPQLDLPEICHTRTGERHPLPQENEVALWERLFVSPGRRTIIITGTDPTDGSIKRVYGYDLDENHIHLLGTWTVDNIINLAAWLDDYRATFISSSIYTDTQYTAIQTADIREEDSLRTVFENTSNAHLTSASIPDAYLATRATRLIDTGSVGDEPCRLSVYLPTLDIIDSFDLGYDCGGAQRIGESAEFYYLLFEGSDIAESTIYRFDAVTETHTPLVSGEFEALQSVSPDGEYVAVTLDDDGKVDPTDISAPQLAVLRVDDGEVIYQQPSVLTDDLQNTIIEGVDILYPTVIRQKTTHYVLWLNSEYFLIRQPGTINDQHLDELVAFARPDEPQPVDGEIAALLPDGETVILETGQLDDGAVLEDGGEVFHQLDALHLPTGERYPITQPLPIRDLLAVTIDLASDGTLTFFFEDVHYKLTLKAE